MFRCATPWPASGGTNSGAPGSTLKVKVDTSSPFAYGMPEDALAAYLAGGQVYETVPGRA